MHRIINSVYTFFSILGLIGVFLNFYKKWHFLNFPNICLIIIRISIRLLDFEDSYHGFGAYYWQYLLCIVLVGVIINIHVALNFCLNNCYTYIILIILYFYTIFCILYGIQVGICNERNRPFEFTLENSYIFTTLFAAIAFILF